MQNRLAEENSPYLLQHAHNPVDWYPWGPEALEKAREEDKPIFLSIGYAACHWCHVMAHESFEDPQTAALMNQDFINIKVDREERPDLDSLYMQAVTTLTGSGGWPMSVFLTPDGQPFYGGTYFPPVRRYQMPSFPELLQAIARLWREDRQQLLESAKKLTLHLQTNQANTLADTPLNSKSLDDAARRLMQAYDWQHGGWGKAPKFPQPMAIEFLLQRAALGDQPALAMAEHALQAMAQGGMYDVVGGGFARYSTDDRWLIPHFEKMLYDNAQLARVYLQAYMLTDDEYFRQVCEESLDFLAREFLPEAQDDNQPAPAGFYSSLDADSEGKEGKYYVWSSQELDQAFHGFELARAASTDFDALHFFKQVYGIQGAGNFEGKFVLQRAASWENLSQKLKLPVSEIRSRLDEMHIHLRKIRDKRIRPSTDDKVLVSWNGLALLVYAEAARYLKRNDYLEIARHNADFLLTELHNGERLLRSWRNGSAQFNAYLEDYAALGLGLLALYQSDPDPYWFNSAQQLAQEIIVHFSDPQGGFFDTRDDHESLLLRPKDIQDNATPSGNAMACQLLLELAAFTGNGEYRDIAERMLRGVLAFSTQYPTAFAKWLCALDFALSTVKEVAILGDPDETDTQALVASVWSTFRPHTVLAQSAHPPANNSPALLHNRRLKDGKATAYVCEHFTCQQPVTDPELLLGLLDTKI
jgi:uncharacterized protein YyaL (SSP411 family)